MILVILVNYFLKRGDSLGEGKQKEGLTYLTDLLRHCLPSSRKGSRGLEVLHGHSTYR